MDNKVCLESRVYIQSLNWGISCWPNMASLWTYIQSPTVCISRAAARMREASDESSGWASCWWNEVSFPHRTLKPAPTWSSTCGYTVSLLFINLIWQRQKHKAFVPRLMWRQQAGRAAAAIIKTSVEECGFYSSKQIYRDEALMAQHGDTDLCPSSCLKKVKEEELHTTEIFLKLPTIS